jgi:two-component system, chemotaxis family, protein-glutamate methylesterase/glutaminase
VEAAGNGQIGHGAVQRDLVAIGASAGGVDALQALVRGLPPEFPAALLVVLHVPSTGTSVLPQILARSGPLPATFAEDGAVLERGQIYVAPADHHMLVRHGRIHLTQGPRENGHRPAIDPLFRSAARARGPCCVGVVLSGLLDDGATGLRFVKESGGAAVVQEPGDAQFPSMPRAALSLVAADRVVGAADMGHALCELIDEVLPSELLASVPVANAVGADRDIEGRDRVEIEDPVATAALLEGPPSALTCPECGGALWEQVDGETLRFACHVGHAYTLLSLLEEQGRDLEGTLWSAVRSLEERAEVHRRLARRTSGAREAVYDDRANEAQAHARSLREMLSAAGRIAAPVPDEA